MSLPTNIQYSDDGRYYTVNHQRQKIKYAKAFPIEWALYDTFIEPDLQNLSSKSSKINSYVGSVNCANCRKYGSYNGVFVQYCKNCVNQSERPGCNCMLQKIMPKHIPKGKIYGYECDSKYCIFRTYLRDVNLCEIGFKKRPYKKYIDRIKLNM